MSSLGYAHYNTYLYKTKKCRIKRSYAIVKSRLISTDSTTEVIFCICILHTNRSIGGRRSTYSVSRTYFVKSILSSDIIKNAINNVILYTAGTRRVPMYYIMLLLCVE